MCNMQPLAVCLSFPGGSVVKKPPAKAADTGSTLVQEDALEKEMVTHSSILAWEIPWTGKSGGQQSMRLQDLDMT